MKNQKYVYLPVNAPKVRVKCSSCVRMHRTSSGFMIRNFNCLDILIFSYYMHYNYVGK